MTHKTSAFAIIILFSLTFFSSAAEAKFLSKIVGGRESLSHHRIFQHVSSEYTRHKLVRPYKFLSHQLFEARQSCSAGWLTPNPCMVDYMSLTAGKAWTTSPIDEVLTIRTRT